MFDRSEGTLILPKFLINWRKSSLVLIQELHTVYLVVAVDPDTVGVGLLYPGWQVGGRCLNLRPPVSNLVNDPEGLENHDVLRLSGGHSLLPWMGNGGGSPVRPKI